ncbi:MAG: hypothetical protein IJ957_00045, partial [Rikenellaceae bacterium]|nr:hypothetical protein [Rikenellaceae bacterium]
QDSRLAFATTDFVGGAKNSPRRKADTPMMTRLLLFRLKATVKLTNNQLIPNKNTLICNFLQKFGCDSLAFAEKLLISQT